MTAPVVIVDPTSRAQVDLFASASSGDTNDEGDEDNEGNEGNERDETWPAGRPGGSVGGACAPGAPV